MFLPQINDKCLKKKRKKSGILGHSSFSAIVFSCSTVFTECGFSSK